MKTIWKFPLEPHEYNRVEMPKGAEILTAQIQNKTICIWAQVDPNAITTWRTFQVVGTGAPLSDATRNYIATVQIGPYVFHVFEYLD